MTDRIAKPALFTRNPSELIVGVGFVGIDFNRPREAGLRFSKLPPLLIDEPEVVNAPRRRPDSKSPLRGCA
jgi:hypothetical protein